MKRSFQVLVMVLVLIAALGTMANPETVEGAPPKSMGPTGEVEVGTMRLMRPTEDFLRDISMLPPDIAPDCVGGDKDERSQGWIVGDDGVVLSYCNGIWDQSIIPQSISTNLYGVTAVTPTLAFAVGSNGTVLKYGWDIVTEDYTWTKFPIPDNKMFYRIALYQNGTSPINDHGSWVDYPKYLAWIGGEYDSARDRAILIKMEFLPDTIDPYGHPTYYATFEDKTDDFNNLPPSSQYFGMQALSVDNMWAAGGNATQATAIHWDGDTWTAYNFGNAAIYGLHFISESDGWAVGEQGQIFHFNGSKWSAVESPVTSTLIDVSFAPDGTGWASGYNAVLLKYTNGHWQQFTDLRTDVWDYYAMDYTSEHGWMVGQNPYKMPNVKIGSSPGIGGQILEFSEPDQAWLAVTIPTDNRLNDVVTLSDNDAWAVGAADEQGATILHWDGRHWQRWYQPDAPIPGADLNTIDMISPTNGWAAGSPSAYSEAALLLHWDGRRWRVPRYRSPINEDITSLRLNPVEIDGQAKDFGWAIADAGSAIAKYNFDYDYWDAVHTFGGLTYNLRGLSLAGAGEPNEIAAWAVGRNYNTDNLEWFLKYQPITTSSGTSYYWERMQTPPYCPPDPLPPNSYDDGAYYTNLHGIRVMPGDDGMEWGFATGDYRNRATIYQYDGYNWNLIFCEPLNPPGSKRPNPSRLYDAEIVPESGIGWFAGYFTDYTGLKTVFAAYKDVSPGLGWIDDNYIYPINGINAYKRPISALDMSSDTMGWAVGEKEDTAEVGVLYQYPYPNFTIISTPSVIAVRPGGQAQYTVLINSIAAGLNNVQLDFDFPADITGPGSTLVSSQDPTQITVTVPADYETGKYEFTIYATAAIHSGDIDLLVTRETTGIIWVTDHPIQSVAPDHGLANTVVTIQGDNFGSDPGPGNRSTESNNVVVAKVDEQSEPIPDENVLSWSNTQIEVIIPDDTVVFPNGPELGSVVVTSNGTPSSDNLEFQLESNITEIQVAREGDWNVVSVSGTSFGLDPKRFGSVANRNTATEHITLDGERIPYSDISVWSNNLIIFRVRSEVSLIDKVVNVTSNGFVSNFYPIPAVAMGGSNVYLPLAIR